MVVRGLNISDQLEKYNHNNPETMLTLLKESLD